MTQIRNESPRLKDWIRYHSKVIGFDHFLFYLDNCTDDSEDVLKSLQSEYSIEIRQTEIMGEYPEGRGLSQAIGWEGNTKGLNVKHSSWPIERMIKSYTDGFGRLKKIYDWIAIFDVDEWIVPTDLENFNFRDELSSLKSNLLYLQTYDFRPPYDYNKSIIEQKMCRWTIDEKMSVNMKGTGKSIFRGKICLDKDPRITLHWGPETFEHANNVEGGAIEYQNGRTGYKKYLLYEFRSHTENCGRPLSEDQYQLYDDSLVKLFEMYNLI